MEFVIVKESLNESVTNNILRYRSYVTPVI